MNSDITNPLMDSSTEKNYRETTNQENPPSRSSKREESKERISMGEYDEELLNNSVQEDFFFDAGERRIVSVNAILKPNALYINLLTNEDKRIFSLYFISLKNFK